MKKIDFTVAKQNNMDVIRYALGAADAYDDKAADKASQMPNIIPFQYQDEDGRRTYTAYAHEDTTLDMYMKNVLTKPEVLSIMGGLAAAFEIGAKGIPVSYIVKDSSYIFINKETLTVKVILLPLKQDNMPLSEIPAFFREIISGMRFHEADTDNYVARILTQINASDFTASGFKTFIDAEMEKIGMFIHKDNGVMSMSVGNEPAPAKDVKVNKLGVMNNMRPQGMAPQGMPMPPKQGTPMVPQGMAPMPPQGMAPQGMPMPPKQGTPMVPQGMAPMPPQGMAPQGMPMPPKQGAPMPPQGMAPMPPQGMAPMSPQGMAPMPPQGMPMPPKQGAPMAPQGMPPMAPQGMAPQGMPMPPKQGAPMPPQGMPPMAPQGMAMPPKQGAPMPPQGMAPQGAPVPQGMPPQGMAPIPPQGTPAPTPKKEDVSVRSMPVMPSQMTAAKQDETPAPAVKENESEKTIGNLVGQLGERPVPHLIRKKTGETINLTKPEFKLGKAVDRVDYAITDNVAVSRVHCIIVQKNGVNYIKDNGSTNHTYLDGAELQPNQEMLLKNKMTILLGDEEFTFLLRKGE